MYSEDYYITCDTNDIMCDKNSCVFSPSASVLRVSDNCRARKGYAESSEKLPLQQLRTVIQPFNDQLANHPIFTHPLSTEILLSILESEYAIQHQLNFRYKELLIKRVIISAPQYSTNIYSCKKNNTNGMKFTRLLLFKIHLKTI